METNTFYSDAMKIILEIKKNSRCPNCGGSFHNSTCIYCKSLNPLLEEKIRELKDITDEVIKNINPTDEKFNIFLSALYAIDNIDFINDLLTKYDYFNKMDNFYQEIVERIEKDGKITQEEIPYVESIILRNDINEANKGTTNYIANYFIRAILYNNLNHETTPIISYEIFEEMIKNYTTNIMKNTYGYPSSTCEILPSEEYQKIDEDSLVLGDNIANTVRFNEDIIKALYYYGNAEFIEVFNHELRHSYQYKEVFSGHEVSLLGMIATKDKILRDMLPNYYQENYKAISYEKDAFAIGIKSRLMALEIFGLEAIKKHEQMQEVAKYQNSLFDTKRLDNGVDIELDELFNKTIINTPTILKRYPQLNYLYKLDNNIVIPKTIEELKEDYEHLDQSNITEGIISLYEEYLQRNR